MAETANMTREELVAEVERLRAQLGSCGEQVLEKVECHARVKSEIEQLHEAGETVGLANLIVENSPAVLFRRLADDTRKLVYVSENLSQWGYSATDFLSGKAAFENILCPEDKDRLSLEIQKYQDQNVEEYAQEYRIVAADGEIRWVSDETSVVRDEQGHRLFNQGVLLDITSRKLAAEALAASEYKFRKTIEGAAEGYLLMDENLVIKEVNDAYCRMLGYERQDLLGRRPHDFATLEYQRFLESNSERFRTQVHRRFEGSMVHKGGHVVPVLINANTLQDEGGNFLGNVAFVADLTEQKKAMDLAGEVQKSLLPRKDPKVQGLDVAGSSVASEVAGGDYFDYLEDVDAAYPALSVAVGDISGHGVDAALLMTTARGFLRMRAGQPGSPGQIITEMNRHLADDLYGSGRFMTLFYVRLDSKEAKAQWVRAGHDPAVIYCPVLDVFTELGTEAGLPLGVIRETRYFDETGELKPGQIIAVGTDGIWEARNREGVMFGKARYKEILRKHADGTAREILNAVFDAVHRYTGGSKPDDDITLVIIKYGPEV
ncbi:MULTISPECIES: SpoIIE family protein phosphatase [unclassified Pseudodesulfovibrio]|uniref:SpoIIE family protein phosphatase n=1 Tax=unclassified Pseudodesulfovibrio TaxID=2661612 RepID=UPI000FEB97A1|nr:MULTISPECIES: SpoIIE family protein phosphatase [unclassified Pseudodesulfovibrio]MCJ2165117.1 SpoIIE family protein phosphatase [Pseudodesulfovibrio sp. S3-i]RWU03421.1 PAS domain S-box protein [Pseudodesulfovibrio sp. S3]